MRRVCALAPLAIIAACNFDGNPIGAAGDAGLPDARIDANPVVCTAPFAPSPDGCHAFPAATGLASLSWAAARAACQALGGDLPVLETGTESAHVASAAIGQQRVWLGLTGTATNGANWTWVDGQTVAQKGLSLWVPGQPDASDDCAMVRPDNNAQWSGRACTNKLIVVCEKF